MFHRLSITNCFTFGESTYFMYVLSVPQNNAAFRFSSLIYGLYILLCFSDAKVHWWLNQQVLKFQDSVSEIKAVSYSLQLVKKIETQCCCNTDNCLLYTSPSPRDGLLSRMPSSA